MPANSMTRFKNCAMPFENMKMIAGALFPQKLAMVSPQQPAKKSHQRLEANRPKTRALAAGVKRLQKKTTRLIKIRHWIQTKQMFWIRHSSSIFALIQCTLLGLSRLRTCLESWCWPAVCFPELSRFIWWELRSFWCFFFSRNRTENRLEKLFGREFFFPFLWLTFWCCCLHFLWMDPMSVLQRNAALSCNLHFQAWTGSGLENEPNMSCWKLSVFLFSILDDFLKRNAARFYSLLVFW